MSHSNKTPKKPGGSRYAALAIFAVLCVIVGAYLLFTPATTPVPSVTHVVPKPVQPVQPQQQSISSAQILVPDAQQQPVIKYPTEIPVLDQKQPQRMQGPGTGQLAIIIDDMGTNLQEARSLAGIGVPLTFSIIPGLHKFQEVAAFADNSGIETMIHIPMQPKGWPERRLEANGLLVSMTDSEISERMDGFTRTLPKAVGANNHMGSEFTEHDDKMRAVLETLKGRGLFFVDSMTSPKTVGAALAKEIGMKSGRRQVFLDNEQNETYIRGQINQAVRLAKKTGMAIAICHPHPVTIRTLKTVLPGLERQGVTLVAASKLVR